MPFSQSKRKVGLSKLFAKTFDEMRRTQASHKMSFGVEMAVTRMHPQGPVRHTDKHRFLDWTSTWDACEVFISSCVCLCFCFCSLDQFLFNGVFSSFLIWWCFCAPENLLSQVSRHLVRRLRTDASHQHRLRNGSVFDTLDLGANLLSVFATSLESPTFHLLCWLKGIVRDLRGTQAASCQKKTRNLLSGQTSKYVSVQHDFFDCLKVSQAQWHHGTVSDRHRTMLSGTKNEMLLSRPFTIFPFACYYLQQQGDQFAFWSRCPRSRQSNCVCLISKNWKSWRIERWYAKKPKASIRTFCEASETLQVYRQQSPVVSEVVCHVDCKCFEIEMLFLAVFVFPPSTSSGALCLRHRPC